MRRTLSARLGLVLMGWSGSLAAQAPAAPARTLELSLLDTTCAPCRDFYQFAVGGGLRSQDSADSTSTGGGGVQEDVEAQAFAQLQQLLDSLALHRTTLKETTARKLGMFYASCLAAPSRLSARVVQQTDWLAIGDLIRDSTGSRDRRCVVVVDWVLTTPLLQQYVKRYFPSAYQRRVEAIATNVQAALRERLAHSPWLDDSSRTVALAKLAKMTVQLVAPTTWPDVSGLVIPSDTDYQANMKAAAELRDRMTVGYDGRPEDPLQWRTVWRDQPKSDGFFGTELIVIPATLLQPPFFDNRADEAVNYGTLGVMLAHQLAHEFVGQGLHYVSDETLFRPPGKAESWGNPWVTEEILKQYRLREQQIALQFADSADSVRMKKWKNWSLSAPADGTVADWLAVQVAYAALHMSLGKGKAGPAVDGFTPDQRFFLARARTLRERNALHPLDARVRTNWPLMNLAAFAAAWRCPAGTPMVRPEAERVTIW